MTIESLKIRCPKCGTVYSIDNGRFTVSGKRSARCLVCESRFFVENGRYQKVPEYSRGGATFLHSYVEKRSGAVRRRCGDRRRDVATKGFSFNEFTHDIIPIFNNEGNGIIGHISPGRRNGADRRSGIERRCYLKEQNENREESFPEYRLDVSSTMLIDN